MVMTIMLLSVSSVFAFESSVATGMNVAAVEDENGLITVTVSLNDATTSVFGVTLYLDLKDVKAVKAADTSADATSHTDAVALNSDLASAGWAVTSGSYTAGSKIKVVAGAQAAQIYTNQELFKMYFVKTGATLAEDAFALGTTSAKQSKISYSNGDKTTKNNANPEYFGIKVTPYVADTGIIANATETFAANTLTFAGKVKAFETAAKYGVNVNGKDFDGAVNGSKVSTDGETFGNTTVSISDWTGEFQIVLNNIFNENTTATTATAEGYYYVDAETQAYNAVPMSK